MGELRRKKLYLASPYGFSKSWKVLQWEIKTELKDMGFDVFDPFEQAVQDSVNVDPYKIMWEDLSAINECDGVFAVINGEPPDVGVAVEIGYAAFRKPIFLFRDDFRRCTDSDAFPVNLMLLAGQRRDWEGRFIDNVNKIKTNKELEKWRLS